MKKARVFVSVMLCVLLFGVTGSLIADIIQWEEIHTNGQDGVSSAWTRDVDNRAGCDHGGLYVGDSALYFCNGQRDYSHIERSVDGSKLSWLIGSMYSWDNASTWNPGIAVWWDENNWVRFYPYMWFSSPSNYNYFKFYGKVNGTSFSLSQGIDTDGDGTNDYPKENEWYSLKLVFTDSQVKCEYALGKVDNNPNDTRLDDGTWVELDQLVINRPDSLKGTNAIFIYGKGDGGPNPDLDNSYSSTTGCAGHLKGYHTVAAYVPEPATISLIGLGALGFIRRK